MKKYYLFSFYIIFSINTGDYSFQQALHDKMENAHYTDMLEQLARKTGKRITAQGINTIGREFSIDRAKARKDLCDLRNGRIPPEGFKLPKQAVQKKPDVSQLLSAFEEALKAYINSHIRDFKMVIRSEKAAITTNMVIFLKNLREPHILNDDVVKFLQKYNLSDLISRHHGSYTFISEIKDKISAIATQESVRALPIFFNRNQK